MLESSATLSVASPVDTTQTVNLSATDFAAIMSAFAAEGAGVKAVEFGVKGEA